MFKYIEYLEIHSLDLEFNTKLMTLILINPHPPKKDLKKNTMVVEESMTA